MTPTEMRDYLVKALEERGEFGLAVLVKGLHAELTTVTERLAEQVRVIACERDLLLLACERAERYLAHQGVKADPGTTLGQIRAAIAEVRTP